MFFLSYLFSLFKAKYSSSSESSSLNNKKINLIEFRKRYHESFSGEYIIAWRRSDNIVYFIRNNNILFEKNIIRPAEGKASDEGIFIINSFNSLEKLESILYCFNEYGDIIFKYKFNANLRINGLSSNGKFAITHCAHSKSTDGNSLTFFDLKSKKILWRYYPPFWPDSLNIDCRLQQIFLKSNKWGIFRLSFDGDFIDKEKWEKAVIKNGDIFELYFLAKEKFDEAVKKEDYTESLTILKKALKKIYQKKLNSNFEADIYRLMGEIYDILGDHKKTITYFKKALKINPNIGVKRRLKKIIEKYY